VRRSAAAATAVFRSGGRRREGWPRPAQCAREAARDQVPSERSPSGLPWRRQRPPRRSGKPMASSLDLRVRVWAGFGDFSRVRVSAVVFGGSLVDLGFRAARFGRKTS
jgi:hypothetical protein